MSYREQLSQWERTVSTHLPHLSRPQAKVLALWSLAQLYGGWPRRCLAPTLTRMVL
jgi:hypothetical protein